MPNKPAEPSPEVKQEETGEAKAKRHLSSALREIKEYWRPESANVREMFSQAIAVEAIEIVIESIVEPS